MADGLFDWPSIISSALGGLLALLGGAAGEWRRNRRADRERWHVERFKLYSEFAHRMGVIAEAVDNYVPDEPTPPEIVDAARAAGALRRRLPLVASEAVQAEVLELWALATSAWLASETAAQRTSWMMEYEEFAQRFARVVQDETGLGLAPAGRRLATSHLDL